MNIEGRQMLFRIEMRLAHETGYEMSVRTRPTDAEAAYIEGLLRAWRQVRHLRETGKVIEFNEHGIPQQRATA